MSKKNKSQEQDNATAMIEAGAEIGAGAIGAALGMFAGGPAGAAALGATSSAAAVVLKGVSNEVARRVLSPRETIRAGCVIAVAAERIKARTERGEQLRQDGFFDKLVNNRSSADEIVESVILKAQREPEEKKLLYMGYLLSNICFDSESNVEFAHQIIKTAEHLSYTQLCLLKLFVIKEQFELRTETYQGQNSFPREQRQVLYDCYDLYNRGLTNYGKVGAFSIIDITPSVTKVQGLGVELFELMGLATIPQEALEPLARQLS